MKMIMQCEHCNFENAEKNLYCKRCGAPLPVLVPYHPSIEDYISPPQTLPKTLPYHFIYYPRPRTSPLKVMRAVFFFVVALPVVLMGLIGGLVNTGTDMQTVCLTFLAAVAVLCASTLLFYRARHRHQHLGWSGFMLGVAGVTTSAFLAFEVLAGIPDVLNNKSLSTTVACSIIMLYGLALEGVALW
jgi:hypothetical protein